MNALSRIFAAFLIAFGLFFAPAALAQINNDVLPVQPSNVNIFNPSASTTPDVTSRPAGAVNLVEVGPARIMTIILGLFGLLSIVMAIYAGAQIIFSEGDPKKIETGVKTLAFTAIGMLVVSGAWVLVRLVLNINLTTLW
ncbi:hypothetical protein COW46_03565 [Candidatus Gracilibacteria bacterium CG17_big_fil_post_rev_8_21_14_2_50_48_13]|nr:MAG: hypothetical protein COW46_03565 [Candidatus Gracilibacteria bacterium CG17_big_fil_post_rev_8_21_14_2_50_48_13]